MPYIKQSDKDEKFYRTILEKAYKMTGPNNDFVNSCENFLNNRGFLSDKQVESLGKVTSPCDEEHVYGDHNDWRD